MKYSTKITGYGALAMEFLENEEMNFIIIFNNDAPEDLAEIAVLHEKTPLLLDPAPGDTLLIGEKAFEITAVGDEALHTLRELGHCTLSFKGGTEPERPGCIMLSGEEPVTKADFAPGTILDIH